MKDLQEYITESSNSLDDNIMSKIDNKENIIANDANIKDIIRYAINKLGNNADLNFIDVSKVTSMLEMFSNYSKFNGDISNWNVSNVKDMSYMFESSKFNGDISNWDVSNVTNMFSMFANSKFNQDISKWDVSHVIYMDYMFYDAKFNQDISNWNVSKVKNYEYIFDGCSIKDEYKPNFINKLYKNERFKNIYNRSKFRFII